MTYREVEEGGTRLGGYVRCEKDEEWGNTKETQAATQVSPHLDSSARNFIVIFIKENEKYIIKRN